jgi:uncharacterized protein YjbJ (UPF0337 family)
MNNDTVDGNLRSIAGEGKELVGSALADRNLQMSGAIDRAAGEGQSALGSVKESVAAAASAASEMVGFDAQALREQINRLTESVNKLVTDQVSAATDTVSRAASATQDSLISMEDDFEKRIRRNPMAAFAIAVGAGAILASLFSPSRR